MDYTNNSATPFVVFGITQVIGGAIVAFIPVVKTLLKRRFPPVHESIYEMELKCVEEPKEDADTSELTA